MDTPVKTQARSRLGTALVLCAIAPVLFAASTLADNYRGGGGGGRASAPSAPTSGARTEAPHFAAHPGYAPRPNYSGYAAAPHVNTNENFASGHSVHMGPYLDNRVSVNRVAPPHFAPGPGGLRVAPGRYVPGSTFHYGHWNGGYWRGGFWPRTYWGGSVNWFLPVLPLYCATYYWNSIPYYYYNDVYYTYDPSASGYVVTSPPPAQEASAPDESASSAPDGDYSQQATAAPSNSDNLYAYPKNGQSEEQQSEDRQECARWASGQTASDGTGSAIDYQRALSACLQGRGYSVD